MEFHVHIHHAQSSSTQQRVDKSRRLGRPSAGPRKPLITGPSCPQCRPLIVLSENRCGRSLARSAAQLDSGGVSEQTPVTASSPPCCLTKTSGADRRPPESPPPPRFVPAPPQCHTPHGKYFKQGGNRLPPPLRRRKACRRVWLSTFVPRGPR